MEREQYSMGAKLEGGTISDRVGMGMITSVIASFNVEISLAYRDLSSK